MLQLLILLLFLLITLVHFSAAAWTSPYVLSVYYPNWVMYKSPEYNPVNLPIDYVSDVHYAFFGIEKKPNSSFYLPTTIDKWADFDRRFTTSTVGVQPLDSYSDNSQGVWGNFGQFKKLKAAGKVFKFLPSVGGWTNSKNWSIAMSTDSNRRAFSQYLVNMTKQYTFIDGWSLDYEYPCSTSGVNYGAAGNTCSASDGVNFATFLKLLRSDLNAAGLTTKRITVAVTANFNAATVPVADLTATLDELHIMTYDFSDGSWGETVSRHQTNLYPYTGSYFSIQQSVDGYIAKGFPANKIMIGSAYYTRGFANTDGLMKPASGGSPDGELDYAKVPVAGSYEYYDTTAQAFYTYDPKRRVFNSVDSPRSVKAKCEFVKSRGLKGLFVWEISKDRHISLSTSLTRTAYNAFHNINEVVPNNITTVSPTATSTAVSSTKTSTSSRSTTLSSTRSSSTFTSTRTSSVSATSSSIRTTTTTSAISSTRTTSPISSTRTTSAFSSTRATSSISSTRTTSSATPVKTNGRRVGQTRTI